MYLTPPDAPTTVKRSDVIGVIVYLSTLLAIVAAALMIGS